MSTGQFVPIGHSPCTCLPLRPVGVRGQSGLRRPPRRPLWPQLSSDGRAFPLTSCRPPSGREHCSRSRSRSRPETAAPSSGQFDTKSRKVRPDEPNRNGLSGLQVSKQPPRLASSFLAQSRHLQAIQSVQTNWRPLHVPSPFTVNRIHLFSEAATFVLLTDSRRSVGPSVCPAFYLFATVIRRSVCLCACMYVSVCLSVSFCLWTSTHSIKSSNIYAKGKNRLGFFSNLTSSGFSPEAHGSV
ncbi:unnamed protein product [Protopolystoma xenopodis]|uniref:Uncharacterized protein n=1 Tax=Protopolystoma xenopodis TaxID=117903 RepID=A0A3S5CJZ3_9PLAT|nr:unnamed protein product [Protopolystoma xenopodis]